MPVTRCRTSSLHRAVSKRAVLCGVLTRGVPALTRSGLAILEPVDVDKIPRAGCRKHLKEFQYSGIDHVAHHQEPLRYPAISKDGAVKAPAQTRCTILLGREVPCSKIPLLWMRKLGSESKSLWKGPNDAPSPSQLAMCRQYHIRALAPKQHPSDVLGHVQGTSTSSSTLLCFGVGSARCLQAGWNCRIKMSINLLTLPGVPAPPSTTCVLRHSLCLGRKSNNGYWGT